MKWPNLKNIKPTDFFVPQDSLPRGYSYSWRYSRLFYEQKIDNRSAVVWIVTDGRHIDRIKMGLTKMIGVTDNTTFEVYKPDDHQRTTIRALFEYGFTHWSEVRDIPIRIG